MHNSWLNSVSSFCWSFKALNIKSILVVGLSLIKANLSIILIVDLVAYNDHPNLIDVKILIYISCTVLASRIHDYTLL